MAKYGKIYTFENAKEARHLIGKKVAYSDIYSSILSGDVITGDLQRLNEGEDFPFIIKNGAWQFIREIEEEEKPVRMTNRQLAKWCAGNNGQVRHKDSYIRTYHNYGQGEDDVFVREETRIRPWDSDEWIVPTVDIYNRDCKGE